MGIRVIVTPDFARMSTVAADIVTKKILETLETKREAVLGLAAGNSPTGLYKHLARAANAGIFDARRCRSFNLDEYVGLPGDNAQQRVLHPESYTYFMIRELFGLLDRKFIETSVPCGSLIDRRKLIRELRAHTSDWEARGAHTGKSIAIRRNPASPYLGWIRKEILDGYAKEIVKVGGIDVQIVSAGGRGHVAFHESGIPFSGSTVMLVRLDNNTVADAVEDGHFASAKDAPKYAVSMGAELVYRAKTVVLLANGARKTGVVARSLLDDPTCDIPISYGQYYAANGGDLVYVVDRTAGRGLLDNADRLKKNNVEIREIQ